MKGYYVRRLNYVSYVLSCFRCLVPYVFLCLTCLVPYVLSYLKYLLPYVPHVSRVLCLTCLASCLILCLTCLTYSCTSLILYLACSQVARTSNSTCSCGSCPSLSSGVSSLTCSYTSLHIFGT